MAHERPTTRIATSRDAATIAELGARTFITAFGPQNDARDIEAYVSAAFSEKAQSAELSDPANTILIAEGEDGAAAGYAQLRFAPAPPFVDAEYAVELVRIYADRPGGGVGSALMAACLDIAKSEDADTVWLGVWEHNPRAISFYERWGFRVVGTQGFVLGTDHQTDLVMSLHPVAG